MRTPAEFDFLSDTRPLKEVSEAWKTVMIGWKAYWCTSQGLMSMFPQYLLVK